MKYRTILRRINIVLLVVAMVTAVVKTADARYYDAVLGRFLSPDTVEGPNRYAYVGNNPVNMVDPTGNESERWNNLRSEIANKYLKAWLQYGAWLEGFGPEQKKVNELSRKYNLSNVSSIRYSRMVDWYGPAGVFNGNIRIIGIGSAYLDNDAVLDSIIAHEIRHADNYAGDRKMDINEAEVSAYATQLKVLYNNNGTKPDFDFYLGVYNGYYQKLYKKDPIVAAKYVNPYGDRPDGKEKVAPWVSKKIRFEIFWQGSTRYDRLGNLFPESEYDNKPRPNDVKIIKAPSWFEVENGRLLKQGKNLSINGSGIDVNTRP